MVQVQNLSWYLPKNKENTYPNFNANLGRTEPRHIGVKEPKEAKALMSTKDRTLDSGLSRGPTS